MVHQSPIQALLQATPLTLLQSLLLDPPLAPLLPQSLVQEVLQSEIAHLLKTYHPPLSAPPL